MNISEQEKKQILDKYKDNTSDEILNFLKRRFSTTTTQLEWMPEPIKMIIIDDRAHFIEGNKKYLEIGRAHV